MKRDSPPLIPAAWRCKTKVLPWVTLRDPSNNTSFAYVGKRTTGTETGDYIIPGPTWKGQVPSGMTQISSPNNSVLVIGRVFVESDSDVSTAYGLAKQIQLAPLYN
jgi:hypothetical protein